jgi:hypothetical protein
MKYIYKIELYIKNRRNVYTKYKCEKSEKMTCFIWKLYEGLVGRHCDHRSDESCRKVFIPDQKKDYHEDGEMHCLYYHKTRLQWIVTFNARFLLRFLSALNDSQLERMLTSHLILLFDITFAIGNNLYWLIKLWLPFHFIDLR